MKNLIKKCLAALMSSTLLLSGAMMVSTPICAQDSFPSPGYNEMTSEAKVFNTNDQALSYAKYYSYELYYKTGQVIEYQVTYDANGYCAHFYAYGWKEDSSSSSTTPSATGVVKSEKILAYELAVRTDAGTQYSQNTLSPLVANMVVDVYESKQDSNGATWDHIKINGVDGWISSDYTQQITTYTGTKDTTADANEQAFASGKTLISSETRVFTDNNSAVAYAQNYGAFISNRNGGVLLYYYVSYAGADNFVLHFYK